MAVWRQISIGPPGVSGPPTPPFGLRPWSTVAEWWTTFDFDAGKRDELPGTPQGSLEKWLESLRDTMVA
jgi:hypothetical protein